MTTQPRKWLHRLGIAAALLVLLVLIAGLALHLYGRSRHAATAAAFEAEVGSLEFAHLEEPLPPEEDNAAAWLQAGAAAIVWSQEEIESARKASRTPTADWTADETGALRALVERNRDALRTLRQAVGRPESNYGLRYSEGLALEIPDLLGLLRAGFLLNLEARLAFADGDARAGLEILRTMSRLADSLSREHTLITALVAFAVETRLMLVVAEVAESSADWTWDPAFPTELEATFPGYDPVVRVREILVVAAGVISHAARFGYLEPGDETRQPSRLERYLFGDLTAVELIADVRRLIALSAAPYGSDPERFDPGPAPPFYLPHKRYQHGDRVGFRQVVARAQGVAAQRQLMRAALRLRQLAVGGAGYPPTRPELTPLTTPSPLTGQTMVYRRRDDGSLRLEIDGAVELLQPLRERPLAEISAVLLPPPAGEES